ncbi:MAG: hypothetical protein ABEJ65_10010, partial [bacterium]
RLSVDRILRSEPNKFERVTKADLVLILHVDEISMEQFDTTETTTLYQSESRLRNTNVHSFGTSEEEKDTGSVERTPRGPGKGPGRRV